MLSSFFSLLSLSSFSLSRRCVFFSLRFIIFVCWKIARFSLSWNFVLLFLLFICCNGMTRAREGVSETEKEEVKKTVECEKYVHDEKHDPKDTEQIRKRKEMFFFSNPLGIYVYCIVFHTVVVCSLYYIQYFFLFAWHLFSLVFFEELLPVKPLFAIHFIWRAINNHKNWTSERISCY